MVNWSYHSVDGLRSAVGPASSRLPAVTARRTLVGALLAGVALALSGCAHGQPPPAMPSAAAEPTAVPSYDATLPPARAVLALVPAAATTVELTDFTTIRRQVGLPELTSGSSAADRAAFAQRAPADTALLSPGLLRPVDARLRASYGFGQDDVAWEARFSGGGRSGWVLSLRPGVDPAEVRRAVAAGVGPLRGARLDAADRLVTHGVRPTGDPVWGSDPAWARLLPGTGEAFVLRRTCEDASALPGPPGHAAPRTLQPLGPTALTFGDHVATIRMSRNRDDLFARLALARRWPLAGGRRFGEVFRDGVGDPAGGRIGFVVPRPARAVSLLRAAVLPYDVCGGPA